MFICLSSSVSFCISVSLNTILSAGLPLCHPSWLSICLCLSTHLPFFYQSICPCVCLSASFFGKLSQALKRCCHEFPVSPFVHQIYSTKDKQKQSFYATYKKFEIKSQLIFAKFLVISFQYGYQRSPPKNT